MKRIVVALSAVALGATGAGAQEIGFGLSGGQVTDEAGAAHRGLTATTYATWREDKAVVRLHAQATGLQQHGWMGGGGMALDAVAGSWGPLRLALSGHAAGSASSEGYRAVGTLLSPDVRVARGGWGAGAGPRWAIGGQHAGDSRLPGTGTGAGRLPFASGDGGDAGSSMRWADARGVGAAVWGSEGPVSLHAGWSAMRADRVQWRDWTAAAALQVAPTTLAISAGLRTGHEQAQWVAGSAAVRLGERAALRLEAGSYPSDPLMGRAPGSYASVGLSLSAGRQLGTVRNVIPQPPRLPDGRIRLSLRARPGARVELLGDWTDWRPRAVAELEPGSYGVDVALPAGTHRFLFRVDGEGRVPEGFQTEPDRFGGRHAVIRVGEE